MPQLTNHPAPGPSPSFRRHVCGVQQLGPGLVVPIGPVMICGVPEAAIAEPHSVWRSDVGLPELLLDPVELLADPIDWLPNTEFGLVRELGLKVSLGVPAEPADCVALEFEGPSTVLGFAGELGLVGTAGL